MNRDRTIEIAGGNPGRPGVPVRLVVMSEEAGQQFAKIHGSNLDQSRLRKAILLQTVR